MSKRCVRVLYIPNACWRMFLRARKSTRSIVMDGFFENGKWRVLCRLGAIPPASSNSSSGDGIGALPISVNVLVWIVLLLLVGRWSGHVLDWCSYDRVHAYILAAYFTDASSREEGEVLSHAIQQFSSCSSHLRAACSSGGGGIGASPINVDVLVWLLALLVGR